MILCNQIKHCKICFNEIKDASFYSFFSCNNIMCEECFSKFKPIFKTFKIDGITGLAIYEYNAMMKDLIFKFKGCYDIELKDVFLSRYLWFLKIRFKGYYLVPVPSYIDEDLKRGFNHVVETFSRLDLPMLNIIKKAKKHKQAKSKKKERINAQKNFEILDVNVVNGKKILIVDDVYSTGSSVSAAIKLIRKGKPKRIDVLVVAKNILKKQE